MARIKHIAIATADPAKTAQFYKEVFDLEEISPVDSPLADGYYLSDGHINLAILNFKSLEAADMGEDGLSFTGFHHFGFQVDDAEATCSKLDDIGARPTDPALWPTRPWVQGSRMWKPSTRAPLRLSSTYPSRVGWGPTKSADTTMGRVKVATGKRRHHGQDQAYSDDQ